MDSKQAIICVDDERIILKVLKNELIKTFGTRFHYEAAESGEEALEIIDELVVEGMCIILILSDWLMPGIMGDELLMRVNAKYPRIKSIMISGQADQKAIETAKINCNLTAFVSKPWKKEDLLSAIRKCVDV